MRIAFKVPARAFWLPMRALANLGRSFTPPSPPPPQAFHEDVDSFGGFPYPDGGARTLHPAPCTLHPDVDSYGRISSRRRCRWQARDGSPSLALALATRR